MKNLKNILEEVEKEFDKQIVISIPYNDKQEGSSPDTIKSFITHHITEAVKMALEEEQNRILAEGRKLINWNKEPKNQMFGVVDANTRINAIQQLMDRVKEPMSCAE